MTVSREQLKCRKYLWGWEESTEAEACTVHLMLHRLGGTMSTIRGVRQKRLLLLSSEMKSCDTTTCFLPVTPQKLTSLSALGDTAAETEPLSLPWFVSRYGKCGKTWSWSQLTSVSFPLCPKGIGTASRTSSSSTCSKIEQKKSPPHRR